MPFSLLNNIGAEIDPSESTGPRKGDGSPTGRSLGLITLLPISTDRLQLPGARAARGPLTAPVPRPNHPRAHLEVAEEAAAEAKDGLSDKGPKSPRETPPACGISPTPHVS